MCYVGVVLVRLRGLGASIGVAVARRCTLGRSSLAWAGNSAFVYDEIEKGSGEESGLRPGPFEDDRRTHTI